VSSTATGCLIRDDHGNLIWGFASNLDSCLITRAEIRAIIQGMEVAWFLGIRRLHIQCDSLLAVKLLLQKGEPLHQYSALILASRNWEVTISHTFREGNIVADLLAHHGHTLDFGLYIDCMYPMRLIELFGTTM
ncbi:Putative ribonuclease H protein At1g65750, partial [Linum perenne]